MDLEEIISESVLDQASRNALKIWFLHNQDNNLESIQKTLSTQAVRAGIPLENIQFTTENTKSHDLAGSTYMCNDELLYRLRNEGLTEYHERPRTKNFTALVRTHKEWRAITMCKLWTKGLHERGYFSYNNHITVDDDVNPIDVDSFGSLKHHTEFFLKLCPFHADLLNSDQHRELAHTVDAHHDDAYFNFVLESSLTGPVRLTEKVFKPIKHCQPFVIAGAYGSIQQLRDMGYRTFDTVVDHSYDQIEDVTKRWEAVCTEMCRIAKSKKTHTMYTDCREDLLHNQQLFLNKKVEKILICLK